MERKHKRKPLIRPEAAFISILTGSLIGAGLIGLLHSDRLIRSIEIQKIATNQAQNVETRPVLPWGCQDGTVLLSFINWSASKDDEMQSASSAVLARRFFISIDGELRERLVFLTADHTVKGIINPQEGFDSSIDGLIQYSFTGTDQKIQETPLELKSIINLKDQDGKALDSVIVVADDLLQRLNPDSPTVVDVEGWPQDTISAVYLTHVPLLSNVFAPIVSRIDTSSITAITDNSQHYYSGYILMAKIADDPKTALPDNAAVIDGSSGGGACVQTTSTFKGTVAGAIVSTYPFNTRSVYIVPFPANVNEQINAVLAGVK